MKTRKGVFFDMDGVLVQTEKLRAETHAHTVEILGGTLPISYYAEIGGAGRSHNEVQKECIAKSGITISEGEYSNVFHAILKKRTETIEPINGIPRLLWELRKNAYAIGLVSSSDRAIVEMIIVRTRLWRFFDTIVTGNDVARIKPFPDGYLLAQKRLGVAPDNAVAIEDSESGIRSALSAGIPVIAYRHSQNERHDFSGAKEIASFCNTSSIVRLIEEVLS